MDLSALVERYGDVPPSLQKEADAVWMQLQKQSEHVLGVKATANFGVDMENTALRGQTVHKGLIVTLKPSYTLSAEDSWLHPNLNQCRALFEGGALDHKIDLSDTNDIVGRCAVQSINEIGEEHSEMYTIVDTHMEHHANSVRDSWNGKTVQAAYSTELRDQTLARARELGERCGADRLVKKSFTNVLFRGPNTFHFYNNAYKDEGLVLNSPLTGYTLVKAKDHAADYLDNTTVMVNELNQSQQQQLFRKVSWNSSDLINTFAMRKTYSKQPATFRMKQAIVSVTPILSSLTPAEILRLTPTTEHLNCEEIGYHSYYDYDRLEVPVTQAVMTRLLDLRDVHEILNSDYYIKQGDGSGKLILPRHIVESL